LPYWELPRTWLAAALTLALTLLYLFDLGGAGFLGPDEPRYAAIGREMAASGDWVTPRLNGSPWFEKPPLLYWTTAIAIRAGLRDEWAARLPVALESLAFLALFFELLRRAFSLRVAATATAILSTSAGWAVASFAAVTDLPMSAALAAAMLLVAFGRDARGWLAGALLGLAILAKGFVPVVLFAPWFFAARGRRRAIVIAAVAVAAPWYVLCLSKNGSAFWNDFFWKQHVQRALSAEALQHGQPFWYYIPVLLGLLFPWTPVLGLAANRKIYEEPRVRALGLWLVFALVFFSAVPNKLPLYVLPLLPALAVVLASALDQARAQPAWIACCVALLLLAPGLAAGLPDAFLQGATKAHWALLPSGLVFLVAAAFVWRLGRRREWLLAMLAAAVAAGGGIAYLKAGVLPVLDRHDSVRAFWRAHPEAAQACLDRSVSRTWQYGLEYYAGRALPSCGAENSPRIAARGRALVVE